MGRKPFPRPESEDEPDLDNVEWKRLQMMISDMGVTLIGALVVIGLTCVALGLIYVLHLNAERNDRDRAACIKEHMQWRDRPNGIYCETATPPAPSAR